jgi:two-component system LytT family response regulator
VQVVAECADGQRALEALETHHPDLVFLDVHMPDLDGFGVLEKITEKPQPKIIFTTAYDKYALKAFESQALDYLLKPFSRDRFQKTMVRVRETMQADRSGQFGQQVASILKDIKQDEPTYIDRLVFKSKGRIVFLRVNEIQWVAAEGNYLRIHVGQESHLLRETMANLEGKLDPEKFLRIHRSTLVNLRYVKEIHPWFGDGESVVILHGGTQLSLSRGYRHKLGHLVTK